MRSDLIFGALAHVTNRYQLCQLASKATRKLHKPNTRFGRHHERCVGPLPQVDTQCTFQRSSLRLHSISSAAQLKRGTALLATTNKRSPAFNGSIPSWQPPRKLPTAGDNDHL